MSIRKYKYILDFVVRKLLNYPRPYYINFRITDRCNLNCKYCAVPNHRKKEMSTKEVLNVIDKLDKAGTLVIALNGGEPVLRKDIKQIVQYIKSKNIKVLLFTNGVAIPKKIESVKNVDCFFLSLDGPKKTNDFIRGDGSYDKVIETIKLAKKNDIGVIIGTTITKYNIFHLDYLFGLAKKYGLLCYFQMVSHYSTYPVDLDYITRLQPTIEDFRKGIKILIENKKYTSFSTNSIDYLSRFPKAMKLKCYAGKFFYNIEPDGEITPCICTDYKNDIRYNILDKSFKFKTMSLHCNYCWAMQYNDFNGAFGFDLKSMKKVIEIYKNMGFESNHEI